MIKQLREQLNVQPKTHEERPALQMLNLLTVQIEEDKRARPFRKRVEELESQNKELKAENASLQSQLELEKKLRKNWRNNCINYEDLEAIKKKVANMKKKYRDV